MQVYFYFAVSCQHLIGKQKCLSYLMFSSRVLQNFKSNSISCHTRIFPNRLCIMYMQIEEVVSKKYENREMKGKKELGGDANQLRMLNFQTENNPKSWNEEMSSYQVKCQSFLLKSQHKFSILPNPCHLNWHWQTKPIVVLQVLDLSIPNTIIFIVKQVQVGDQTKS